MSDPQRITRGGPVERRIRAHVEAETGIIPGTVHLVWTGIRAGIITFDDGTPNDGGALPVSGAFADEIHALETGRPIDVPNIQWTSSAWKRSRS